MSKLDLLARYQNELLLAEAIGWLHDYRKCSDEQLKGSGLERKKLLSQFPALSGVALNLLGQTEQLEQLLNNWKDKVEDSTATKLLRFLSRSHNTAHFDKQESVGGQRNYPNDKISTPFGFEKNVLGNLTNQLWHLPWNDINSYSSAKRETLREAVSALFSQTVADTRRPINEVDLWSWGLLVGTLYKAALAGALLTGNTPPARDLRWRLLSIRVNGLDYLLNVAHISDLLVRHQLLVGALDKVRHLLENHYPLGAEVYRDEDGSIYVVPDMTDLLEQTNSEGKTLRTLVEQAFAVGTFRNNPNLRIGGEIIPHIELEASSWWGQDPHWPNSFNDELPAISELLSRQVVTVAKADEVKQSWQTVAVTDICTVCGLRPQGPSKKAADRNVCDICEQRRADRSQEWATSQPDKTIWTDEVADANGRLALIVGRFDLTHWLDGGFLDSLLLIAPHDPQNTERKPITSKTPSFSRLRRIWETTRRFWQEVQTEALRQLTDDRRRLKIYLDRAAELGPFHVYDLDLGATDLSVVWVPPQDGESGYLISADNLSYIVRHLGAKEELYGHPAAAAIFVEDFLKKEFVDCKRQPVLRNPDARAGQTNANLLTGIHISKVEYQENPYAMAIPILAEPRTFMMIVPGDKTLTCVKSIKEKYETEMAKVRDRLPLHVNVVYANRHTPIRAVLDAGRAMLNLRVPPQKWKVKTITRINTVMHVILERSDHQLTWDIPLKMGDGITEDRWYQYLYLDTGGDDSKADAQKRRAVKVKRPTETGQPEDCWVVHIADLRENETVYLWPSTFDFELLDTAARRFEVHYDENGRRTTRRTRPYYLEDLERLETLWSYLKRLSKLQRRQIIRTLEATRETWYGQDDDGTSTTDTVLRQFVNDTLAGASWPKGQPWESIPPEWQEKLVQAGVRGELADLAELHMEILKE